MDKIFIAKGDKNIRFDGRNLLSEREIEIVEASKDLIYLKSGKSEIEISIDIVPYLNNSEITEENKKYEITIMLENDTNLGINYTVNLIKDDGNVENMVQFGIYNLIQTKNFLNIDGKKIEIPKIKQIKKIYIGKIDNFIIKDLTKEEKSCCEKILIVVLEENNLKSLEVSKGFFNVSEIETILKTL